MSFVNPVFLFGLFALGIPIIIHLFNFRKYTKIFFSNVQFLKEIEEEKSGKEKLKHLLILACRLLAIFFLVVAFAQPYFLKSKAINPGAKNLISVYVDNSQSMNAQSVDGNLLEEGKFKAKEIISHYHLNDQFNIICNDFDGLDQRFFNKEDAISRINELRISNTFRSLDEVIIRQAGAFADKGITNNFSFLISDFQKSNLENQSFKIDTGINYTLLPLKSKNNSNISIDTSFFLKPLHTKNGAEELVVKLNNFSESAVKALGIKLYVNQTLKALGTVNIDANSFAYDTLKYNNPNENWIQAKLEIADFPIAFDNEYYFSYPTIDQVSVLNIKDKNTETFVESVFKGDGFVELKSIDIGKIDFNLFQQTEFIVLNQPETISSGLITELEKFVSNGGSLFFIPSLTGNISTYNNLQNALGTDIFMGIQKQNLKVNKINFEHPLLENVFEKKNKDIDLPNLSSYLILSRKTQVDKKNLLELENEDAFLNSYTVKKGQEYVLCSDLNAANSNFSNHPLFVPILYKMALNSFQFKNASFVVGNNQSISLENIENGQEGVYSLKLDNNEFVLGRNGLNSLSAPEGLNKAGNYELFNRTQFEGYISYNYNRKESNPDLSGIDEIKKALPFSNVALKDNEQGVLKSDFFEENSSFKLWKLCILLVLLFLALEMLLIQYFDKIKR